MRCGIGFCVGNIDYFQPLLLRIADSVSRSPATFSQIADADAAIIHQMAVALVHTVSCVFLARIDDLICLGLDTLVFRYIPRPPSSRLGQAWEDQDQFDGRAALPQMYHCLGGEGVEPQSATSPIESNTLLVQVDNGTFQSGDDLRLFSLRYLPMACKAAGLFSHTSIPLFK